jgi:hypothetical protein
MPEITIHSRDELEKFANNCKTFPSGTKVFFKGELCSIISKTFVEYHKYKQADLRADGLATAAAIGLCFGPTGWVASAGFGVGYLYNFFQKGEIHKSFTANPLSNLVQFLIDAKYTVRGNDGISLMIVKG